MFVTYNGDGLVTAYSDKERNVNDLAEGETQQEVNLEFDVISCTKGSLTFTDDELKNHGEVIASTV